MGCGAPPVPGADGMMPRARRPVQGAAGEGRRTQGAARKGVACKGAAGAECRLQGATCTVPQVQGAIPPPSFLLLYPQ